MDKYSELRAALEAYDPGDTSTWAGFWDHVTLPTIRALLAERDALIHDNAEYVSAASELATENQRLLEALRSIVDCCDEDHTARDYASRQTEMRGIARAALAQGQGGSDAA